MDKTKFREILRFESDLDQCIKCGFCAFFCPVYQEEKLEASLARGKNELVKALISGELDFTPELADRLYKCTACMACTDNCPTKARISRVVVAARADVAHEVGVRFPLGFVYRNLLPNRRLFGHILRASALFQSAFMPKTNGIIRHLPNFFTGLGKDRQIPSIAPKFLRDQIPVVNKPPAGVKTVMRVGYFSGCMNDFVMPHIAQKTVDFLIRNGVEVVMPRGQGCCGAPVFLGAGDFATGRLIADANVAAFEGLDLVVADCATCTCALEEYPRFLADTPERKEAFTKFAAKTRHVTQLIVDLLKLPASVYRATDSISGKKLTWHDPCHLNRHLGIKAQPRQIIRSIPGTEYVEMPNADRCCGMAGQFSLYYYELSKKIAEKTVESVEASGADIVVTACPGCQLQLLDNLTRMGNPKKVMNLMELLG